MFVYRNPLAVLGTLSSDCRLHKTVDHTHNFVSHSALCMFIICVKTQKCETQVKNRKRIIKCICYRIFTICTNLVTNGTIGEEISANGKKGNANGTNGTNVTNQWYHWENPEHTQFSLVDVNWHIMDKMGPKSIRFVQRNTKAFSSKNKTTVCITKRRGRKCTCIYDAISRFPYETFKQNNDL